MTVRPRVRLQLFTVKTVGHSFNVLLRLVGRNVAGDEAISFDKGVMIRIEPDHVEREGHDNVESQ